MNLTAALVKLWLTLPNWSISHFIGDTTMKKNDISKAVQLTIEANRIYGATLKMARPTMNSVYAIRRLHEGKLYLARKQARLAAQKQHCWKLFADTIDQLYTIAATN
jgi:hypothetical protein